MRNTSCSPANTQERVDSNGGGCPRRRGGLGDDTTEESTRYVLAVVVPAEHEPDKVQRQQPADQLGKLGDVAADEQAREDERE